MKFVLIFWLKAITTLASGTNVVPLWRPGECVRHNDAWSRPAPLSYKDSKFHNWLPLNGELNDFHNYFMYLNSHPNSTNAPKLNDVGSIEWTSMLIHDMRVQYHNYGDVPNSVQCTGNRIIVVNLQ